jgi:hypothetical protein
MQNLNDFIIEQFQLSHPDLIDLYTKKFNELQESKKVEDTRNIKAPYVKKSINHTLAVHDRLNNMTIDELVKEFNSGLKVLNEFKHTFCPDWQYIPELMYYIAYKYYKTTTYKSRNDSLIDDLKQGWDNVRAPKKPTTFIKYVKKADTDAFID